jgi:hypothetical protein
VKLRVYLDLDINFNSEAEALESCDYILSEMGTENVNLTDDIPMQVSFAIQEMVAESFNYYGVSEIKVKDCSYGLIE